MLKHIPKSKDTLDTEYWKSKENSFSYAHDFQGNDEFQINNTMGRIVFKRLYSPIDIDCDIEIYQKNRTIQSRFNLNKEEIDLMIKNLRRLKKYLTNK